jgi:hypothetical protein
MLKLLRDLFRLARAWWRADRIRIGPKFSRNPKFERKVDG